MSEHRDTGRQAQGEVGPQKLLAPGAVIGHVLVRDSRVIPTTLSLNDPGSVDQVAAAARRAARTDRHSGECREGYRRHELRSGIEAVETLPHHPFEKVLAAEPHLMIAVWVDIFKIGIEEIALGIAVLVRIPQVEPPPAVGVERQPRRGYAAVIEPHEFVDRQKGAPPAVTVIPFVDPDNGIGTDPQINGTADRGCGKNGCEQYQLCGHPPGTRQCIPLLVGMSAPLAPTILAEEGGITTDCQR